MSEEAQDGISGEYLLGAFERNERPALRVSLTLAHEQAEELTRRAFENATEGDRITLAVPVPVDRVTVTPMARGQDGELEPAGEPQELAGTELTVSRTLVGDLWFDEGRLTLYGRRGPLLSFGTTEEPPQKLVAALEARNARLGLVRPGAQLAPALQAREYPIQTSQETDAVLRAAADGRTGRNWSTDLQACARVHREEGSSYHVRMELTEEEKADGLTVDGLEALSGAQDADGALVMLYVSRLLAPPAPLPPNAYAGGWVDLDDVAARILPAPRSRKEREQNRRRIYAYLLFGARARVIGRRSVTYLDKVTQKPIPTQVDSPLWAFLSAERPQDASLSLWPTMEAPLRQELVMTREWSALSMNPATAQYLPLGEVLGAIPPAQAAGAWARVLGLALANFWRRNPRETLDGTLKPTRRELLTRYTPAKAPPLEVLNGPNPLRALAYWRGALAILCDCSFLAREGEPSRKQADMKANLPRYEWQDAWLSERVDLQPGARMRHAVATSAKALPEYRPQQLAQKRRGRPRKRPG